MAVGAQATSSYVCGGDDDSRYDAEAGQGIIGGGHREPQMRFRLAIIGRPGRAVNTKDDNRQ